MQHVVVRVTQQRKLCRSVPTKVSYDDARLHEEAPGSRYRSEPPLLGEQVDAGLCELHVGAALMHYEPAAFDRELQASAIFGWRSTVSVQKRRVDLSM